ncbi:MAG TPA: aminopeptidase [Gemmatimonadaceae bacterium]
MPAARSIRFLLAGALALCAGAAKLPAQARPNAAALARALVERMALQPGESVLLVGVPGEFDALADAIRERVRAAQGRDLGALAVRGTPPASWETTFTRTAAGRDRRGLATLFAGVDLAVMMPGVGASDTAYVAMQDVLRSGRGRTIHFHWSGAYALDGTPLPITPNISAVYERVVLRTDYARLAELQRAFEQAARGAEIRVTTPAGTDLRFRIGNRPVTKQDGDASAARARQARNLIDREIEIPAGAIRVAPDESTVSGQIAFPPSQWGGERVEGLVMTFLAGRVTRWEARTGRAGVERELAEAGEPAHWFREFALGFNRLLAIPAAGERWIPYYGYGAGVVRLSLGDNTELGGTVTGGYVRWNFFTDATVTVGDEVWVRNGQLIR